MNYKAVLEALLEMKAGKITEADVGICSNLIGLLGLNSHNSPSLGSEFLTQSLTHIYGKKLDYPIEGDFCAYIVNVFKWDKNTEFGLRRWELLDKMIAYAESNIQNEE